MSFLEQFKDKIISKKLTRTEARVAEYILGNINMVCFMSAFDLAKELKTSSTSINRTAKALGYNVYNDLQKDLRDYVSSQAVQADRYRLPPGERIEEIDSGSALVSRYYEQVNANLKSIFEKNSAERIDRVVELIASKKNRYVYGYRSVANIAGKTAFLLRLILGNVNESYNDSTAIDRLLDIGEDDCMIAFNFNRYSRRLGQAIEFCLQKKACLILFTDCATAPYTESADEVLIVDVSSPSYFNSNVALVFLIELICAKLALYCEKEAADRLSRLEPYIKE